LSHLEQVHRLIGIRRGAVGKVLHLFVRQSPQLRARGRRQQRPRQLLQHVHPRHPRGGRGIAAEHRHELFRCERGELLGLELGQLGRRDAAEGGRIERGELRG